MPTDEILDPAFFWETIAKSSPGFALTALVVCAFMAAIVVGMLSHAETQSGKTQSGRRRLVLLAMIAAVAGVGVWTTHFVAMLGFRPDFRLGYDPTLTLLSAGIGMALVGVPLAATALVRRLWQKAALGAMAGAGVGAMHFTGMGALQGCLAAYDPSVTALALVLGMLAVAAAMAAPPRRRLLRGGLIALGVCLLHFTAMAGLALEAAPRSGDLRTVEPITLSAFVALASLLLSAAAFVSVTVTARLDAQARAAAEAEARQRDVLSAALHNMTNGLVMVDRNGSISLYNNRTLELLGLGPGDVAIGMSIADYVGNIGRRNGWSRKETDSVLARRLEIISKPTPTRIDQQYADGTVLSIVCQPMPGGGAILTYDDLTEQRAAKAEIEYMAYHDTLTGLPNRRYLAEKMRDLVAQGGSGGMVALLHVDLDRFKQINDSFGHAAGDKVLCHVAGVLRDAVRRTDIAVRVGGDEFVVFCEAATELSSLTRMAQRIIDALSRPFHLDGEVCHFGASVGIAREKLDGLDCETLMSRADIALYDAKRAGRGRLSVFTEAMKEQALAANHLRDDIRRGIEAGEFHGVYHPQFDARSLDLVGVEALARWDHPVRGVLAPEAFAAIAEELGVIDAIDSAILACAVRDHARWIAAGCDVPKISVNVSARRLRGAGLVDAVRALDLPRGVVTFELLESIDLDEPDAISAFNIDGLRDLGVGIEIDDFGTGRTSIVSLVRLRPDRLKIDRQLIAPIVHSKAALNLVASIVEIGRTLGIGVTAEGVETTAHAEMLRGIGCGVLQGFAFSKPLPAHALAAFLSSQNWREPIRRQG